MSENSENWLTKKAFADSQGWSPSYVTKLKDQGKLVLSGDGKRVDVVSTLARLRESADPGKQYVAARHSETRTQHAVGDHVKFSAPDDKPDGRPDASDSGNAGYWVSKSQREAALARLAELELERELGHLVSADAVHRGLAESSRMLRDMILAVPSRVAGQVISLKNAGEAEGLIRAELRKVLEQFVKLSRDGLIRTGANAAEAES
jgi:hypothetical protein